MSNPDDNIKLQPWTYGRESGLIYIAETTLARLLVGLGINYKDLVVSINTDSDTPYLTANVSFSDQPCQYECSGDAVDPVAMAQRTARYIASVVHTNYHRRDYQQ